MYKVLLVDDERMILEGISRMVDWASEGAELSGTARNGIEAMDWICEHTPDIVITDIRMPGMDGLQLVEKCKEHDESIECILLSGFNEFDYARQAMRFGVKHYLLKPCSEQAIQKVLREVILDLKQRENRKDFLRHLQQELNKVLPHAKQQFLKELVTNKTYGVRDWENYRRLFGLSADQGEVRLMLFQLEGATQYEHMFALQNIAEDILGKDILLLSTTIGQHVLILIKDAYEPELLFHHIEQIRKTFAGFYHIETTIALSEAGNITHARRMYRETLECLHHRFYLGEGGLITKKDIGDPMQPASNETITFPFDEDKIVLLIKAGRWHDVEEELRHIFDVLSEWRLETTVAKSYLIQLYLSIIRQSGSESIQKDLHEVARMEQMDTLQALRDFIVSAAERITMSHYQQNKRRHSSIIQKVLDIIHSNLGNPRLSLHWVASEMLYMNEDYLGKLFKKETGEKFSGYVMKLRMEHAVELMKQQELKVFEIADRLGFEGNPQYFSKVFKKYTGCSPTEFLRSP
ncbi:response regulator transcription factor [Marinicrinis lubricantis]|uniref:Response regulator n=1 Tax=Marinicrinis lubricantis TaxID=2086470 RepID=A0ABW1IRS0_9BACL